MSDKAQYFHFTLGPVQGFVAQARRTRDFWAGSFILSWLAAVAMKATQAQYPNKKLEEVISFPAPDQNFMDWLEGKGIDVTRSPTQGSIPNRFKAVVDEAFKPELVTQAVQEAWEVLAGLVWKEDLSSIASTETKTIWDRQIPAFWDMTWIMVENKSDSSALDRRKNWRTYAATNEGGVKCMMMEGWQELSGAERPNREQLNKLLWTKLRNRPLKAIKTDLRENEVLCAIAFVKRRFSQYFPKINHKMEQGWLLQGWDVPINVPSVNYMASVHWLKTLLQDSALDRNKVADFQKLAHKLSGGKDTEINFNIRCLEPFKKDALFADLLRLDGAVFFQTELENPRNFEEYKDTRLAKDTINALSTMRNSVDNPPLNTPFYAILMMDGDSLGKHMSDLNKQDHITKGLEQFTNKVKSIVYDKNGFLIYAGGDDVLAILPLENAIPCAVALRDHYLSCFDKQIVDTTLSGAIEFAHIKMPLTQVLKDAHNLLDEVAKEKTGRDALAIRVWKGGGLQIEWSQPWEIALIPEKDKTYLEQLTQEFQTIHEKDDQFSNKFFYKVRERFSLLNPLDKEDCYFSCHDANKEQVEMAINLLAVDYINSGKTKISELKNAQERIDKAKYAIRPLLNQCIPVKRTAEKEPKDWEYNSCLKADAALLVRFLAQKGVETR